MRRVIFSAVFLILLISIVSADVIITEQPNEMYSLGDTMSIPIKITTLTNIASPFTINLICNGVETSILTEYIVLSAGEETERSPQVPLMESIIGRPTGNCILKAILGSETYQLTDEFAISDYIGISIREQKTEAAPEEMIILEGDTIKDNGEAVQGIAEVLIIKDNETVIELIDTVQNGYFYFNFSLPKIQQQDNI